MFTFPFVWKSDYEHLKEAYRRLIKERDALRLKLAKAKKNDYRDPRSGRYVGAGGKAGQKTK